MDLEKYDIKMDKMFTKIRISKGEIVAFLEISKEK